MLILGMWLGTFLEIIEFDRKAYESGVLAWIIARHRGRGKKSRRSRDVTQCFGITVQSNMWCL